MNKKGFINVILVVVIVIIILGTAGYFVFVKKSEPISQPITTPSGQNTNSSQSSNTPYGNPAYGPVVQGLTQPGIYSNATYGFQINIPIVYSVQEQQGSPGSTVLINGEQEPMFLIWTTPADLSLQDMVKKDMGNLIKNDSLTNITIAGEPTIQVQNSYGRNIYFLIHNGNYFKFEKPISSSNGQFDSMMQSLQFTNSAQTKTSVSTPKDEATNWTLYHNTNYNYSLHYPTNFTIYAAIDQTKEEIIPPTAASDKIYLTNNKAKLFCCETLVTSVSVIKGMIDTKNWRQYGDIPDYRIKSQGEITFAGFKAFEVRGSAGVDSVGTRLILIPGIQFSVVLIQGGDGEPWESITNSFKFE